MISPNGWNSFFHGSTGMKGCRVAGYMRIGFCLCFLMDRILMLFVLDHYFSPTRGLMPYQVTRHNWELVGWHQYSLFMLFPESEAFLWILAAIGILQGFVVLLGLSTNPRWHMLGIYLNLMTFRNHNVLYWDAEDDMFRIWAFFLLFFPLDHCTIHDKFGFRPDSKANSKNNSWPMWIFRLFQIELVLIYMGASLCKALQPEWQDGSAIFRLSYGIQDFPGIFTPHVLFGRYGPLKLLAWSAVCLEGMCYITVWIPRLRKFSILFMILLHVGIDLSMNMHMFEWLSCVGWLVFFIQPEATTMKKSLRKSDKSNKVETKPNDKSNKGSFFRKAAINVFIACFTVSISMDCIPFDAIGIILPDSVTPIWGDLVVAKRNNIFQKYIDPVLTPIGLAQGGDWGMYTNVDQDLVVLRLDAELTNGTIVKNIWRSPNWQKMSIWERKFRCRDANFYDALADNKNEFLYFVQVVSKSFVENHSVKTLSVTKEHRAHYRLKMKSSGGFWSPVIKPPMNAHFEEVALKLSVGTCVNELSPDTCAQLIKERGCKSVSEQCKKSCSKNCNAFISHAVDFWLDPNSFVFDDDYGYVYSDEDDDGDSNGEL